jgi:hypothetical protein
MHFFRLVPASEGPRREFKITLGLRAGHGSAGRIYHLEEAIRTDFAEEFRLIRGDQNREEPQAEDIAWEHLGRAGA